MIGNASKLLMHGDRLADWRAGKPVVPVTLELHLTNRCNQMCSYCTQRHSTTDLFDAAGIIRQAEELGVRGITLSGGGEPMMGPMSEVMCSEMPMGLITNGSVAAAPGFWRRFSWVRFSVDSCDGATYKAIRGVEMPECLEENIIACAKHTTTGVQMVVQEQNFAHVEMMQIYSRGLGADYLHVRPDETGSVSWPLSIAPLPGIVTILRNDKIAHAPSAKCGSGHFIMTVTADGRCWMCACGKPRHCVGDLNRQTLRNVVYSPERAAVLARADPAQCPTMCRGAAINAALEEAWRHHEWL